MAEPKSTPESWRDDVKSHRDDDLEGMRSGSRREPASTADDRGRDNDCASSSRVAPEDDVDELGDTTGESVLDDEDVDDMGRTNR